MSRTGKTVLHSLTTLVVIAVLSCSTAGCATKPAGADLLPPKADSPVDYETIAVTPSSTDTAAHRDTLYSRPSDYRSTNAKAQEWCSVGTAIGQLPMARAHSGEYHAGWAYFIPAEYDQATGKMTWKPLYACDSSGKLTELIAPSDIPGIKMSDFSVSPDGRYVIIYDADQQTLHLWSVAEKKLVGKPFVATDASKDKTGTYSFDTPCGNGSWHEVPASGTQPATYEYVAVALKNSSIYGVGFYGIIAFTTRDAADASMMRYPVPTGTFIASSTLQVIDAGTETVAYDDYPMFFDYGQKLFDFDRAQTPTHLYLYDIRTGRTTCVAALPACRFLAQFIRAGTLEYNVDSDPKVRPAVPKQTEDPRRYVTGATSDLLAQAGIRQPAHLLTIAMITKRDGWAVTTDNRLLLTTDDGATWTDVSPLKITTTGVTPYALGTFFTDAATAYVAVPPQTNKNPTTMVYRTTDAGTTWKPAALPRGTSWEKDDTANLFVSFTDARNGYVLATSSPGLGQMAKALYRTSDGGATFQFVNDVTGLYDEQGHLSGIEGYPTGMAFSSATTGFVTCTYRGQANPQIYKTTDGGRSWNLASQKIQAGTTYQLSFQTGEHASTEATNGYIDAYSPMFIGAGRRNGYMLLDRRNDAAGVLRIYRTADGGATWRAAEVMGTSSIHSCSFINNADGYGVDGDGNLVITIDGGTLWTRVTAETKTGS